MRLALVRVGISPRFIDRDNVFLRWEDGKCVWIDFLPVSIDDGLRLDTYGAVLFCIGFMELVWAGIARRALGLVEVHLLDSAGQIAHARSGLAPGEHSWSRRTLVAYLLG